MLPPGSLFYRRPTDLHHALSNFDLRYNNAHHLLTVNLLWDRYNWQSKNVLHKTNKTAIAWNDVNLIEFIPPHTNEFSADSVYPFTSFDLTKLRNMITIMMWEYKQIEQKIIPGIILHKTYNFLLFQPFKLS